MVKSPSGRTINSAVFIAKLFCVNDRFKAEDYLDDYYVALIAKGNGKMAVAVSIDGVGVQDKIGVQKISIDHKTSTALFPRPQSGCTKNQIENYLPRILRQEPEREGKIALHIRQRDAVRDEGQLYRSIHGVADPGQNTRLSTSSMWTHIGNPLEEFPEWVQPIGAHDACTRGDKMSHNGWTSAVDGNVCEPGGL